MSLPQSTVHCGPFSRHAGGELSTQCDSCGRFFTWLERNDSDSIDYEYLSEAFWPTVGDRPAVASTADEMRSCKRLIINY